MTSPSLDLPTADALWVGRRDHYVHATRLIAAEPQRVVLVQRSSTMLLGPEAGWDAEAVFFETAWRSVESGAAWFHIASLRGIADHLARPTSTFPNIGVAMDRLSVEGGAVGLTDGCGRTNPVKDVDRLAPCPDLKIDRQARMLVADFGHAYEALIVENVGDQQVTLHLAEGAAADLFELGLWLWRECPPLASVDLQATLPVEE